jgi:glycine oxidase
VYVWQKGEGLSARWLEADEAHDLEPNLSPEAMAALYLPPEGQVNSPQLVRAFSLGAICRGATVLEGTRVTGFSTERRRVVGVETTQGRVSAGTVALAAGVTGARLADELGIHLPVHPVKGEILAVNAIPAPIRANVWDSRCYLVPKKDGRVIVGATEEPGVYDHQPTLGGVSFLSSAAVKLIPDLLSAHFATAWGGLRPGTPSGEPILGPVEGWEGLLVATGHYRNGVLLSPVTGEIISALALDEPSPVDISPFLHARAVESATW